MTTSSRFEKNIFILMVDDHPANLFALEAIFDGLEYNLVKASSGEMALESLHKRDYAVILLDVQMPGLNGFETAALIRAREKSCYTPIIFLTAIDKTEEHVFKGYSLGAVDYLFKPIIPEILRAKVAVFVDLQRKTQALEEIRQREQQEREIRLLDQQLAQPMQLAVAAQAYGINPLSKSIPDIFQEMMRRYSQLMELALEQRAYKVDHNIPASLRDMADQLGFVKAGPRDVAEIHAKVLKKKLIDINPQRAQAYIEEGHLMAFELMGHLTSFYRNFYLSARRSSPLRASKENVSNSEGEGE
jgi:response regulator RpfG family c-di-GMP phosphodiesterase